MKSQHRHVLVHSRAHRCGRRRRSRTEGWPAGARPIHPNPPTHTPGGTRQGCCTPANTSSMHSLAHQHALRPGTFRAFARTCGRKTHTNTLGACCARVRRQAVARPRAPTAILGTPNGSDGRTVSLPQSNWIACVAHNSRRTENYSISCQCKSRNYGMIQYQV